MQAISLEDHLGIKIEPHFCDLLIIWSVFNSRAVLREFEVSAECKITADHKKMLIKSGHYWFLIYESMALFQSLKSCPFNR